MRYGDYIVAWGLDLGGLEARVNGFIKDGYVPCGGISHSIQQDKQFCGLPYYLQAMIHRDVHAATLLHNANALKLEPSQ